MSRLVPLETFVDLASGVKYWANIGPTVDEDGPCADVLRRHAGKFGQGPKVELLAPAVAYMRSQSGAGSRTRSQPGMGFAEAAKSLGWRLVERGRDAWLEKALGGGKVANAYPGSDDWNQVRRLAFRLVPEPPVVASRSRSEPARRPTSFLLPAGSTVTIADERELPELRPKATPKHTLKLSPGLWEKVRAIASESRDGLEMAGFLLGQEFRSWNLTLEPSYVVRAVKKRAESSCSYDFETLAHAQDEHARIAHHIGAESGAYEQACYHTHPFRPVRAADKGTIGRPSRTDLRTWLGRMDALEIPFYIGLILTRTSDDDDWWRPDVRGWVVKREGVSEHAVCDPITVEIGKR